MSLMAIAPYKREWSDHSQLWLTLSLLQFYASSISNLLLTARNSNEISECKISKWELPSGLKLPNTAFIQTRTQSGAFRRRKRGDAEDFGKEMRGAHRVMRRTNSELPSVFSTILCAPPKSDWVRVWLSFIIQPLPSYYLFICFNMKSHIIELKGLEREDSRLVHTRGIRTRTRSLNDKGKNKRIPGVYEMEQVWFTLVK